VEFSIFMEDYDPSESKDDCRKRQKSIESFCHNINHAHGNQPKLFIALIQTFGLLFNNYPDLYPRDPPQL